MAKVDIGTKMSAQMRRVASDRVSVAEARVKAALKEKDRLSKLKPEEIRELQAKNVALQNQAQAQMPQANREGEVAGFDYGARERTDVGALAAFKHGADLAKKADPFVRNGEELEAARNELAAAKGVAEDRGKPDGPFKKMFQRFRNMFNGDGFHDNETLGQREVDKVSEISEPLNQSELDDLQVIDDRVAGNAEERQDAVRAADDARGANFTPAPMPSYNELLEVGVKPGDALEMLEALSPELQAEADRLNDIRAAAEPGIQATLQREIGRLDSVYEILESDRDVIYGQRDARNQKLQADELGRLEGEGLSAIAEEQNDDSAFGSSDFSENISSVDAQPSTIAGAFVSGGLEESENHDYDSVEPGSY